MAQCGDIVTDETTKKSTISALLNNLCNHNMSGYGMIATNDNAGVLNARQGEGRKQVTIYGYDR